MKEHTLDNVIKQLSESEDVKGIFLTGSGAIDLKPSSDIDLVIILDKNSKDIKSVYTTIENHFSDIFFFDLDYLNNLKSKTSFSSNSFEGMFVSWLSKGSIKYDPINILSDLKNDPELTLKLILTDDEKLNNWVQVNYNLITNTRYFNSEDELYKKALQFRFLYSVIGLVTAYFAFRDLPWRGEKEAVKYFEANDEEYLNIFNQYNLSITLEDKMKYYLLLFNKTVTDNYPKWEEDFVIPASNSTSYDNNLIEFWSKLMKE